MSKEKARGCFLGIDGNQRLNCALSVAEAFREKYPCEAKHRERLASCGGGNAPGGVCGAVYAATLILDRYAPGKSGEFLSQFASMAGSVKCREIKNAKILSCGRCVELAAELLLSFLPE